MRLIALCTALALRLAAQPAVDELAKADDVLKTARAGLGAKLSTVQSLSLWGADRRGPRSGQMALTIDLSGKYLKEQSSLSTGGQIQRMAIGSDGAAASGGGMPGDEGGPAMSVNLTEGFDGDDYWTRTGAGSGKHAFVAAFVRYLLALTLSPPASFPVAFTYGGRLESSHGTMEALEGKGPDDFLIHLYLDAKTHLPAIMVYHEDKTEMQLWMTDYRTEEGIRFPHMLAWLANGEPAEEFRIDHFKINPKLRPEKFRR